MKLHNVGEAASLAKHLKRTDAAIAVVQEMIPEHGDVGTRYVFLDIWDWDGDDEDDENARNDSGRPAVDVVALLAALKASKASIEAELVELGVELTR